MALTNTNEASNSKYINLKLDRNADEVPVFIVQEDFKSTGQEVKEVKGLLKSLSASFTPKSSTNKWDTYGAKIQIEDGEEIYAIDTTITNGSKDMLNGLLSVAVGEEVTLAVYKNKGGYAAGSAIKDASQTDKDLKYFKGFFPWIDNTDPKNPILFKEVFKTLIYNELASIKTAEQEPKQEIGLEDIPDF